MPNPKNIIAALPGIGLQNLVYEDTVDTDGVAVEEDAGDDLINAIKVNLKINGRIADNTDRINDLVRKIPAAPENKYSAFIEMYNDAKAAANSADQYITAVKIYYGLKNNKIKLYYEPMGLKRNGAIVNNIGYYDAHFSGIFYMYDTGQEAFIKTLDYITPIADYQRLVSIKRDGVSFVPFTKDIDIEAATFSFQEIFALLFDNLPEATVSFYNAAQPIEGKVRHTLLLAPEGVHPIVGLRNVYADLAHLCPPHCTYTRMKLQ